MTPDISELVRDLRHMGNASNQFEICNRAAAALTRLSERTEQAVAAEREACAKLIEPKGPRPCDCEPGACYCRNQGDADAVAAWDADAFAAKTIRERRT